MQRRSFIHKAALGTAAAALTLSCKKDSSPGKNTQNPQKTFNWKMVTTWPPHFPVLGTGAENFAKRVQEASAGQLNITVYGAGELVPALEVFSAVQQGSVELGHSAAYYWAGKIPAAVFFTSLPFGLNAQHINTWLYQGGGLELWQELYKPHGLVPMPCGNTGIQMAGWFNREIKNLQDIQGLKMRIPGMGGQVWSAAGGTAILSAAGEIYTNLERGLIDGAEWVGPYHDSLMGFQKIAKYYYYPGWQEPGSVLELIINQKAWENLPEHLKTIITMAAAESNVQILSEFEFKNAEYLQKLQSEKIEIKALPQEVLAGLEKLTRQLVEKLASSDKDAKRVYTSYQTFLSQTLAWKKAQLSDSSYFKTN